jgi:hypothetical protein
MTGTWLPLIFTAAPGTILSIFAKYRATLLLGIDKRHDLELKHDLLYSILAETAAVLFITPPTFAFERVFTGTGTSCPEAMIAFLLLLVKTVGRDITLNRFVDSSRCTIAAKALPAAT